ncbi:MAG: hypothetical protein AAB768_02365 [Patescibacteria group bacterium]
MLKLLAQTPSTPFPEGFQGLGPLGGETSPGIYQIFTGATAGIKFNRFFSISVGVMTVVAGIWFMIQIFLAGIEWLSSSGEKQAVQNAQKKISHSIIGLLIVVISFGLMVTIGNIFGINLLAPGNIIYHLLTP